MVFNTSNILVIIVLGGLAGGLAKLLMPGRDPGGCIITILLGIAGAFVGTWLGPGSPPLPSWPGQQASLAPWSARSSCWGFTG